jgi:hypothetical protein
MKFEYDLQGMKTNQVDPWRELISGEVRSIINEISILLIYISEKEPSLNTAPQDHKGLKKLWWLDGHFLILYSVPMTSQVTIENKMST